MAPLVNKIYMRGDWPKDFLDVTMIALPKKNQVKNAVTTEQSHFTHWKDYKKYVKKKERVRHLPGN